MKDKAEMFRALAHHLRLEILSTLGDRGEISVTDIRISQDVSQSLMSQHLSVLRSVHLVNTRKDGQRVYYSLNEDRMLELQQTLESIKNSA